LSECSQHCLLCHEQSSHKSYFEEDILKKTPYELVNGKKRNIGHLKVFGCKCYNNGKESLGKFNEKTDVGIFLGYSLSSHAHRIYNKRLMIVEESIHVIFYETNHAKKSCRGR